MGKRELLAAVTDLDTRLQQQLARLLILAFAVAARRIQHDPDVDAAMLRGDHRIEKERVREQKHSYVQRALCRVDRIDDGVWGIIRKYNQSMRLDQKFSDVNGRPGR